MKYARQCMIDVGRYRLHKMGFGEGDLAFNTPTEAFDDDEFEGVHGHVVEQFRSRPPSRVLDLGCGDGSLAAQLRGMGHTVVGVDRVKVDGVGARVDQFVEADLDAGLPDEVGDDFDVVVGVDVLSHLRDPEVALRAAAARLRPGGSILVSIPNFSHWYPRARVATGRFSYDRRGILDHSHLRFFTRASALRMFEAAGLVPRRTQTVGVPVNLLVQRSSGKTRGSRVAKVLKAFDQAGVAVRSSLFAYQYLFELEVTPER
jgi:2-polyprenyl-3-methyl-5-hydroxy-6-metoxy-1,4-benzoquinol methylase